MYDKIIWTEVVPGFWTTEEYQCAGLIIHASVDANESNCVSVQFYDDTMKLMVEGVHSLPAKHTDQTVGRARLWAEAALYHLRTNTFDVLRVRDMIDEQNRMYEAHTKAATDLLPSADLVY